MRNGKTLRIDASGFPAPPRASRSFPFRVIARRRPRARTRARWKVGRLAHGGSFLRTFRRTFVSRSLGERRENAERG